MNTEEVTLNVAFDKPEHVDMKTTGMGENCGQRSTELARGLGGTNVQKTDEDEPNRAHRDTVQG